MYHESPLRSSKLRSSNLSKSNLSKKKSQSLFRLDEYSEDYSSGSFTTLTRETSQVLKKKVNDARTVFSNAAHKIRKVLDSYRKKIILININTKRYLSQRWNKSFVIKRWRLTMNQRLVKAFSCRHIKILYREFFQQIFLAKKTQYMKILTKVWIKPFYNFRYRCNNLYHNQKYILVWEEVYIHVYKLKESELGFYHTGIELHGVEFTYCENKWLWLPDRIIV